MPKKLAPSLLMNLADEADRFATRGVMFREFSGVWKFGECHRKQGIPHHIAGDSRDLATLFY
jgi:hypothetical protein